jgi:hypothetical protein
MANHVLRAHGCADTGAKRNPIHPVLDSAEPPELPGTKPQPIPQIEGVDLSLGFSRSVPGTPLLRLQNHVSCGRSAFSCHATRGQTLAYPQCSAATMCSSDRSNGPGKRFQSNPASSRRLGGHPAARADRRGAGRARRRAGRARDGPPRSARSRAARAALPRGPRAEARRRRGARGDAAAHHPGHAVRARGRRDRVRRDLPARARRAPAGAPPLWFCWTVVVCTGFNADALCKSSSERPDTCAASHQHDRTARVTVCPRCTVARGTRGCRC